MALEIGGSSVQDPTGYQSEGTQENGTFTDGAPLAQGFESGVLMWATMTQSDYASLYSAWDNNQGNLVSGRIPPHSGSLGSYRSVTAYFHEPVGEARGGLRHNVRMRVSFIS